MKNYRAIAEYYDAEYADKQMLQEDVPFLLAHLPARRRTILEIAAGTGRVAIPLAQAGHRVVGFDNAKDMLAIARRKRDAVGLTDRELKLVHADALKLDLGQRFDVACVLFNTFLNFTTLDRQDRLLQRIGEHLKPRGRLWIDIFNPDLDLMAEPESYDIDPSIFYVHSLDRTVQRTVDVERNNVDQQQRVTFKYCWYDLKGNAYAEQVAFDLTFMFPRELRLLLERNGFEIVNLWGDYDGSKLTDGSPRIICDARLKSAKGVGTARRHRGGAE